MTIAVMGGDDFMTKEMCWWGGKTNKHVMGVFEANAEGVFDLGGGAEINEIIHIEADVDGGMAFDEGTSVDAGRVRKRVDVHVGKNTGAFFMPVTG